MRFVQPLCKLAAILRTGVVSLIIYVFNRKLTPEELEANKKLAEYPDYSLFWWQ